MVVNMYVNNILLLTVKYGIELMKMMHINDRPSLTKKAVVAEYWVTSCI